MLTDDAKQTIDSKAGKKTLTPQPKKKKRRKRYRSRPAQWTITILRIVGLGYATILLTLVAMETRLVYPGAFFADHRVSDGAGYPEIETVEYSTTDGIKLRGRLIERAGSGDIVLFFHGNDVKAKWMDDWLRQLSGEFNATAMVAEYRGYDDDLTPNERGVLADSFSACDYLCDRYGKSQSEIILYGQSLGGGCAVALAARGGAKALVLERTFDRLVNVAGNKYPFIPVNYLMRNRYDSIAKLTAYKGPRIHLHGTTDDLIPIQHGEALYACAGSGLKHWIAVDGLGHHDSLPLQSLREIVAKVNEFTAQP